MLSIVLFARNGYQYINPDNKRDPEDDLLAIVRLGSPLPIRRLWVHSNKLSASIHGRTILVLDPIAVFYELVVEGVPDSTSVKDSTNGDY